MKIMNIERFFLVTLLRISIVGVFMVLLANVLLFPEDILSIQISVAVLLTCVLTYFTREKYQTQSVLLLTSVLLITMTYQKLAAPWTTTSLSIILMVGFIVSVLLKGRWMWTMHIISFCILNTIFILQINDAITAAITYSILYFILSYATWILKYNYDNMTRHLRDTNIKLNEKTTEIASQNEELLLTQQDLNALNADLEKIVNERTAKIQVQNQILMKYSYANAHHLRGPVARLLGLASIYKLDPSPNPDFIICKMVEQANEIDAVVKQINDDLDKAPE